MLAAVNVNVVADQAEYVATDIDAATAFDPLLQSSEVAPGDKVVTHMRGEPIGVVQGPQGHSGLKNAGMHGFSCMNATAGMKHVTGAAPALLEKMNTRFDNGMYTSLCSIVGQEPTLDAYAAADGSNALADKWCSENTFLQRDCSGQLTWLDPPACQLNDYLQHYLDCKVKNPAATSCLVVVPKPQAKALHPLLAGMRLVAQLRSGTVLYNTTRGDTAIAGMPYATQVYYDPPCLLHAAKLGTEGTEQEQTLTIEGEGSCLRFTGKVAGAAARIDLDTGASHTFISARYAQMNGLAVQPTNRAVALADGKTVNAVGVCRARLRLGPLNDVVTFIVLRLNTVYDVILGEDWLKRHQAVLNFQDSSMTVKRTMGSSPVVVKATSAAQCTPSGGEEAVDSGSEDEQVILMTAKQFKRHMKKKDSRAFIVLLRRVDDAGGTDDPRCSSIATPDGTDTPTPAIAKAQEQLKGVLAKYKVVFDDVPAGLIKRPGLPDFEVELEPGKVPPVGVQYRLSPREKEELTRQLKVALDKGWIEPSSSPFGAPVLFAPKKNGGLRLVLDYRAVNKITVKNRYPLPRIDDLLDQLNGATIFSGLDLAAGYYQIPVKEDGPSKNLTAFRTPQGLFQWRVMPMGMTNAPAVFQRTMQQVFGDMIGKFVLIYLDDILIFSKTPEEHVQHVEAVMKRLAENKFFAQESKCHFGLQQIEFLGHIVSGEGIRVDPRKIQVVQDWPVPKSVQEVRSFLGLANYFRRFVHAFATIARPLQRLTCKDVKWGPQTWDDKCQQAFDLLRQKLTTAPLLALPDFSKPFEVIADASDYALGAILMQDGRPVAFESRKFTPAEVNYHTTEKELLAVIHALVVWRCYLDGSRLMIFSDHEPLKYLRTKPSLTPRQVRWSAFLERFDYTWEHRPGRLNAADPLSRALHGTIDGSGVGSLTGTDTATETVLEHLAALTATLSAETMAAALTELAQRTSPRERKKTRPWSPPPPPKRQRNAAEHSKPKEATVEKPVAETTEELLPAPSEELSAAYKEYADQERLVAKHSLQLRNGLWYKQAKVFVPPALRQRCISESHDTLYAGHKGVTKTLDAVQRVFWWPGVAADVRKFVTTCSSCQRNKVQGKKPMGLLQPLEVPTERWQQVTMDFITGLPATAAGHDAVLVFCDRLSKMVHFAACTTETDAPQSARLFRDRVFAVHGMPEAIISDRDTRFTSAFWTELMALLGVKHKLSTAFHPQTDGQTERVNRVLEEYLRHFVNPSHDDWDGLLPLAEFAYNNSLHEAVGQTPFYLNYGRHPRLPTDVQPTEKVPAADDFATAMADVIESAKAKLEKARQRAKKIADPARRERQFAAGDLVLLSSKNIALKTPGSNKLLPKFLGPLKITEALSPVTYRLQLPDSMRCHNVFHISQLMEYKTDGRAQAPPPPLDFDDGEGGTWLEIDRVLSHRRVKYGSREVMQYLVQWKGYGPEHNEWRDEAGVTEVATDEYWARVGGRDAVAPHQARRARKAARGRRRGRGRGRGRS